MGGQLVLQLSDPIGVGFFDDLEIPVVFRRESQDIVHFVIVVQVDPAIPGPNVQDADKIDGLARSFPADGPFS